MDDRCLHQKCSSWSQSSHEAHQENLSSVYYIKLGGIYPHLLPRHAARVMQGCCSPCATSTWEQ
eukprot:scaffold141277_cov17-Tisochrysis_lutea.AAC.1